MTTRGWGVWLAIGVAAAVSACASQEPTQTVLAGSCQLNACECVDTDVAFWETQPTAGLLWRENGDAYCPPGFQLRAGTGGGWSTIRR